MAEMDDFDEFSSRTRRRLARFPNFHHGSPLTYFPQRHIIDHFYNLSDVPRIELFDRVISKVEQILPEAHSSIVLLDDPAPFYARIFSSSYGHDQGVVHVPIMYDALSNCVREVVNDLRAIQNQHPGVRNLDRLVHISDGTLRRISLEVNGCAALYRQLVLLRNTIQRNHVTGDSTQDHYILRICDYSIWSVNEIIIAQDFRNPRIIRLMNYDQLLMVVDTITCRLVCQIAVLINDSIGADDLPSLQLLRSIYQWGDSLLTDYGVNAYSVIGEFEAIVTNAFVNHAGYDPLGLGIPFHESLIETAAEAELEYGIPIERTTSLVEMLAHVDSPNQLSEIFGIRKHWGNPMVDAVTSGLAIQEKLDEVLPIDGTAILNLLASFNRLITLSYIENNAKWPECVFLPGSEDTMLYNCWVGGVTRLSENSHLHNHLDWALLRFRSNCVLDQYKDQMSKLSDKSVSLYRSHLNHAYVSNLQPCEHLRDKPPENRRLLLEYLRRPHMPILDILRTVMTNAIPSEWLCNSAAMKGTEMKHLKSRVFAVLPIELRQYFSITEEIIKEYIFKYNPHQTMTMKETNLLEKLRKITKQLQVNSTDRYLHVIHIIDFSKWNLRMRYENTCTVFKSIDDFLGTPGLIEMTHLIFQELVNLIQDAFNPPPGRVAEIASATIWHLHTCGWEGQRQKGWTVLTSALLSYIELITGVHSEICGQGDNQVLLTKFPVPNSFQNASDWVAQDPQGVKEVLDSYYRILERECSKVGLKVKTAESCRSLCYLNYGKRLFFNGVELSMTLKRVSKMFTEPNDTYPTTEGRLKTLEGSIYAANLYSHPGMLTYLMGRIGVYLTLEEAVTNNPLIGSQMQSVLAVRGFSVTPRLICNMMKIPSTLGGPPQQLLPAYMCRGHPDPLCTDLVLVKLREQSGDMMSRKVLFELMVGSWFNEDSSDKSSVISAPHSLNLEIPRSVNQPILKRVKTAVMSYCKNPHIEDLFSAQTEEFGIQILENLSETRPFHPLVVNDLYARTPPGRRDAFLLGISNSTSLGRLVYENAEAPIVDEVCLLEVAQLRLWLERVIILEYSPDVREPIQLVHHEVAQAARDLSWGCHVEGVTVPHPLEQFSLCLSDHDVCSHDCEGCENEHIVVVQHNEDVISLHSGGRRKIVVSRSLSGNPYLGNIISEGLIQIDLHCDNPNSAWQDAVRINVLRRWISAPGSPLDLLLRTIIASRTDVDLEIIDRASGVAIRLSFNHRASFMSANRSSAPCTTTNLHTRLYVSSNRMGQYSRGEHNYHLAFGPSFLVAQALVCLQMVADDTISSDRSMQRMVYHFHVRDSNVPIVYDGDITLEEYHPLVLQRSPDLLFANAQEMRFTDTAGRSLSELWVPANQSTEYDCKMLYATQLIGESFMNEIVHHELVDVETASQYPPRTTSISIGDIGLIGVDTFCEALALHVLIFAPFRCFTGDGELSCQIALHRFLDRLSGDFWTPFVSPLSSPRNLIKLTRLANNVSTYNMTRSPNGIVPILKVVVTRKAAQLLEQVRNNVLSIEETIDIVLGAPSLRAIKPILSRYFELCVLSLLPLRRIPSRTVIAYARDLVANLHTATEENLISAIRICAQDFFDICARILRGPGKRLPIPKLFFLRYAWVDRLRFSPAPEEDPRQVIYRSRENIPVQFLYHRMYTIPESPVFVSAVQCQCVVPDRSNELHLECYFQPAGSLSKSSYKFLEIILSFNLSTQGVVCLGSSTGTEAAAISLLEETEFVYVNCYHPINDFAPHNAASYMPPAFVNEGDIAKLLRPDSAVLSTNDITHPMTPHVIAQHTERRVMTGVTCDAEIPHAEDESIFLRLLEGVVSICSVLPDCEWAIVKLPVNCPHSIVNFVTALSKLFRVVYVVYSSFNRQRSRNFHFVAYNRRAFPIRLHNRQVVVGVQDETYWHRILHEIGNSSAPSCALFPHPSIQVKLSACSVLPSGFSVALMIYLPGFGDGYNLPPTTEILVEDVQTLLSQIADDTQRIVSVAYRTHTQLPLIRAGILDRTVTPLFSQVSSNCGTYLRGRLLIRILTLGWDTIEDLRTLILDFISTTHNITIGERFLPISIDITRFINFYSRYLFEILGNIRSFAHIPTGESPLRVIHKSASATVFTSHPWPEILDVEMCLRSVRSNRLWMWKKRCVLVCLLLLADRFPNVVYSWVNTGFVRLITVDVCAVGLERRVVLENIGGNIPIHFLSPQDPIPDLDSFPAVVSLDHYRFMDVCRMYLVSHVYVLPWSGVYPSMISCFCNAIQIETPPVRHIDVIRMSSRVNEIGYGFVSCCCYSCAIESSLCQAFRLNHSTLDEVCSTVGRDSVLSRHHHV